MKVSRPRITYANVVATLALFIALGGVSWAAATLPKNSVGSKQIKKNAVTSTKIKSNSITGAKVKNNSLTGSDINAGSLGKVPSAGRADSAASSDQVVAVTRKVAPTGSGGSQDAARASATEVPLVGNGQVSIYGKCYVYSGQVFAEILGKTTADGALTSQQTYYYYGSGGYLNTTTPEGQRYVSMASAGMNNAYGPDNDYSQGLMYGPDGNGLDFSSQVWAKQGTVTTYGNGAFGPGNVCIFMARGIKLPPA